MQSAELKAQNIALRDQFGVRGYPTVLLLTAEDKLIDQLAIAEAVPAYVEHLKICSLQKGSFLEFFTNRSVKY